MLKKALRLLAALLGILALLLAALFVYWFVRPNRAQVDPQAVVETWNITHDDAHNSRRWQELAQSQVTRLDGPYLFTYRGRIYAAGRYQPDVGRSGPFTAQGSALARKRTALFEVRQRMAWCI